MCSLTTQRPPIRYMNTDSRCLRMIGVESLGAEHQKVPAVLAIARLTCSPVQLLP